MAYSFSYWKRVFTFYMTDYWLKHSWSRTWFQFLYQTENVESQNFHLRAENQSWEKRKVRTWEGSVFFFFLKIFQICFLRANYLKGLYTSDTCIFLVKWAAKLTQKCSKVNHYTRNVMNAEACQVTQRALIRAVSILQNSRSEIRLHSVHSSHTKSNTWHFLQLLICVTCYKCLWCHIIINIFVGTVRIFPKETFLDVVIIS